MGNRANFAVVENQDWQLYHSHWSGRRMLDALIGGPELALRYARALRPCATREWIDPLWADGGAVVDLDRRRLLFFGDELMVGMAQRRAALSLLGAVWPGYTVVWAYDGTTQLADYLGVELPVRSAMQPGTRLADSRDALCHLVSVVEAGGWLRLWPLWHFGQAWHGPALLRRLPGRGVAHLTWRTIPEGGVHIDVPNKTVGTWHTADCMGLFHALPELWRGWRTECWEDRVEEQVRRCNGALRIPDVDVAAGVDEIRARIHQRVFQGSADSPGGRLANLAELVGAAAPGMVVSGPAVSPGRVGPTAVEWDRFVDACEGLRCAVPSRREDVRHRADPVLAVATAR